MSANIDNGVAAFVTAARSAAENVDKGTVSEHELAQVMTEAVKLYARRCEMTGTYPPPVFGDQATATEVLTVVSEMIRTVDLNMFDLSMWYRRQK
jgi:hypothetical protein